MKHRFSSIVEQQSTTELDLICSNKLKTALVLQKLTAGKFFKIDLGWLFTFILFLGSFLENVHWRNITLIPCPCLAITLVTKLVKFRHSSAFIVGKITTCGSHVYDRPEFRQIFQRWIQRTTQSPNNPETQNPRQQQHGPQEEEGFLLFFLVSTSRHCPPPLGHWGGAASESPAGESRGSLRAPRKYVTAAVSWILLTEATDKTRTFWSNLSHPSSGRNNPRTQSLVLFHEMEIGSRYQKPTDKKCDSFFVKFWPNCFYDVLRFTYSLGLQHQQIGDIFAGFMALYNSFHFSFLLSSFLGWVSNTILQIFLSARCFPEKIPEKLHEIRIL